MAYLVAEDLGGFEQVAQLVVILQVVVRAGNGRAPHLCRNLANWRR